MELFKPEEIEKLIIPNVEVGKDETIYHAKQLFPDAIEVSLSFVVRERKMIIINRKTSKVSYITFENGSTFNFSTQNPEDAGRGFTPLSDWDHYNQL